MGKAKHTRIALLLNLQIGYCRRAIMGIAAYGRERSWMLEDMPAHIDSIALVRELAPDGIIAHVLDDPLGYALEALGLPVVNLSSNQINLALPTIDADQRAVGNLAADYYWDLGYQHYAYFGSASAAFSREREEGYREALNQRNATLDTKYLDYTLRPPFERDLQHAEESVSQWLHQLPKPVAIFCSNDEHSRLLSSLCQVSGISVPESVAILGVDNDETMCLLSSPPLSSVDNPAEQIGYQAATMLDEMITKGTRQVASERVPPLHLIERASTERFAAEDPMTHKAITFIERNLKNPNFSVNAVAEHVNTSRRSLERTFSKQLGITVLAATQRARVRKAKTLLRNSTLPINLVALECGFSNHRRFGVVFRASTSMTPTEFRNYYDFDRLS